MRITITLLIVCVLQTPSVLFAETLYVTQDGAGAQDGSSVANAWSVADFNTSSNWSTIDAPAKIDPGDTVQLHGQIITRLNMHGDGTPGNPITIDGSNGTMNASTTTSRTGEDAQIGINGKDYITLDSINFDPGIAGGTLFRMGPALSNSHATVNNVIITNCTYNGSSATSNVRVLVWKACSFCEFSNNTMTNVFAGIAGDTTNIHDNLIKDNTIEFNTMTCPGTDNTCQRDVIQHGDAYNITIQGNKLLLRGTGAGGWAHNDIIQYFRGGSSPAGDPSGWIIRYNWIELDTDETHDRSWMMLQDDAAGGSLKIYGNVFIGTNGGGLANGLSNSRQHGSATIEIYNNTFVAKNGPSNVINFSPAENDPTYRFKNNIVYVNTTGQTVVKAISGGHTFDHDYNIYWDAGSGSYLGTSCEQYKDTNEKCAINPMFTDYANDDFSLQSGSPAIGAGVNLGTEFNKRLAPGTTWPGPTLLDGHETNIGAYAAVLDSISPAAPGNLQVLD